MPDSDNPEKRPAEGAVPPDPPAETDRRAARVRHRLVGALCILAVAVLLWELGDDVTPPDFANAAQTNTAFPNDDFVQVRIHPLPPPSRIENIPPPPPPDSVDAAATDSDSEFEFESVPDSDETVFDSGETVSVSGETVFDSDGTDSDSVGTVSETESQTLVFAPAPNGSDADDESAAMEIESESESDSDSDFTQVGAFRKSDGAEQLARWLRGDGFNAEVKNENGTHRVYSNANPEHLAALGYIQNDSENKNDSGTESDSISENDSDSESDSESDFVPSPFVVQLGAFSSEERAREMVRQLRRQKFQARIEPVQRGGERLYRVRVVGLPDRDSASAIRGRLVELGYAEAQVIDNL